MTGSIDTSDLGKLIAKLEDLVQTTGDKERLAQACRASAERITGEAKGNVYQDGLTFRDGAIRDSLHAYVGTDEDGVIKWGVETNLDFAIYHELGTGPVGTAAGYPGETDQPIARRSTGWTYWSDKVQRDRIEEQIDVYGEGSMTAPETGFVYTEGVPPKAFMYQAVSSMAELELERIVNALMEGLE